MLPIKSGDICKSQSYNGYENQKIGPLSCENSRPSSSTSAQYNLKTNDLNNNQIKTNLIEQKLSNDKQIDNQRKANYQINKHSNLNLEMSDLSNQTTTKTSNEELSFNDNLQNQNESSLEEESDIKNSNLNVPNYLLLADEQNKSHDSTLYFAPSHGLQHTALGVHIPKLINTFTDENLEFAYQLYSMRQRHQPLMIINLINFVLTLVFICLPIILIYNDKINLNSQLSSFNQLENLFTFDHLKLISINILLNLHLLLPSIILLFITFFWNDCANHRLHIVGYITLIISVLLTQLIEKGQLHLNSNDQIDWLLIDKFNNKPINIDSNFNSSLISANLIKNTIHLFLNQSTWHLMYCIFITYVILPLSFKWSTIFSLCAYLLDLFLIKITTQYEQINCTQDFNLIVSN